MDPYAVFHAPFLDMANYFDGTSVHYQVGGIIRNYDYDALLVGTSMTEAIDPSIIDKIFGGKTTRAIVYGAFAQDYCDLFKEIGNAGKADYVILGLDAATITLPVDEHRISNLYDYVYSPNFFTDSEYLWCDYTALYEAPRMLFSNLTGNTNDVKTFCIPKPSKFGEEKVIPEIKRREKWDEKRLSELEMKCKLNVNAIVKAAYSCKNIPTYIFIPPYSIAYWYRLYNEGTLDIQLKYMHDLYSGLLHYKNIRIFFEMIDQNIITNLNNYRDIHHYNPATSEKIMYDIAMGNNEITVSNLNATFANFKSFLESYDWKQFEEKYVDAKKP